MGARGGTAKSTCTTWRTPNTSVSSAWARRRRCVVLCCVVLCVVWACVDACVDGPSVENCGLLLLCDSIPASDR
jgi:hypothetical protein